MLRMRAKVLPFLAISRVGRPLNSFFGSMRLKQRFRWCSISPIVLFSSRAEWRASSHPATDWLESRLSVICIRHCIYLLVFHFSFIGMSTSKVELSIFLYKYACPNRDPKTELNETACQVSLVVRHTSFGERLWLLEEAPDCIPIMWWT